ncbi:MAG: PQQ-dependent sugar dehydrogenase [Planctomycetes bacterium]|nr:PQQ-dependent sugar dehydrogenase [Planctomycetota bacterium]
MKLYRLLSCLVAPFALVAATSAQMPVGFVHEKIETNWDHPVSVCFLSNDRMLVGEKRGDIWYLENETKHNVVVDLELDVLNLLDRGLLCVTADPNFDSNGYVYLLYAVDPEADGIDGNKEAYCRIERWTLGYAPNGDLIADPNSRFDLIGDVWSTGIPSCHYSHSIGTLRFFSDGSLVASCGDAAHYDNVDIGGQDPDCFGVGRFSPDQDIGAFRSQYANSLAGKILRIDPTTGLGLPDNPWFDGDASSIPSRTWAKGLRNPFRFALLPGSGPRETMFVCDVGWNLWEEVNVARGGENFGWPCREGKATPAYAANDPLGFCTGVVDTLPLIAWHHNISGQIGFTGNCVSGAAVYTGTSYPPIYRDALFFCDYGKNWLRCARLDPNLNVTSILSFGTNLERPIDLQTDPATGDLVYISLLGLGEIRRIRFIGMNQPPLAVANLAPMWGASPLTITFDALESSDPEGGSLEFLWDFDDGTTSTTLGDVHTFADSQNHDVTLTVTDDAGNTATEHWLVSPDNTPPHVVSVIEPAGDFEFHSGVPFAVDALASDAEDDAAGIPLGAKWSADLIHDHHEHPGFADVLAPSGSFTLDSQGPGTYFEIVFTTTDSRGLTDSRMVRAFDADAQPAPHLVSVSDVTPRLGQRITAVGHVEFPNTAIWSPDPTLAFDWGDGKVETFPNLRHQLDVMPTHVYGAVGDYTLTLTVSLGSFTQAVTQPIHVEAPKPAFAVFVPLLDNGFIPWNDQQTLAQAIQASRQAHGAECEVFTFDQQQALVDWMLPYLDDGVQDVLVVLDEIPAALFAGEGDGSLAERWVELGNGILWSGNEPFAEYIYPTGIRSSVGAGGAGAEKFFDTAPGTFPSRGNGPELVTPLGTTEIHALPASWYAEFALRTWCLDAAQWRVAKLYAKDDVEKESDAVLVRNLSGGFFAQIFNASDSQLDRVNALPQFLDNYLWLSPWAPSHKTPPPPPGD